MLKASIWRLYLPTQIWHYGYLQRFYTGKWFTNKIDKLVFPSARILDFGCGDSPHRAQVLAKNGAYSGIDVKPTKFGEVFDGIRAPYENCSFDLVLLEEVLPVAPDSQMIIKECFRILKPGGSLIVSCNFLYPMNGDRVKFQDGFAFDYYRYTEAGLNLLLGKDFKEVKSEQLGGLGSHLLMPQYFYRNFLMRNKALWVRSLSFAVAPAYLILCSALNVLGRIVNGMDSSKIFASDVVAVAKK